MKSTLVRSLVVVLAVAGFTASTLSATPKVASKNVAAVQIINSPTPMCPLNDKNGCGIL